MKTKLHFGVLIILFTFLARYVDTAVSPNQQIVVQFSNTEISEVEAQDAITRIQTKLDEVGAEDIQIGQDQDGQLKITYYSNTDIAQIQHILSDQELRFTFSTNGSDSDKFPNEENSKDYRLSISEIQQDNNSANWDFESVEIVQLNNKSDRFSNLKVSNSGGHINQELIERLIKVALKNVTNSGAELAGPSCKIPEVRAGPIISLGVLI
ncbi:hypothetical protein [Winogradskyella flava]|uniref:Uncharacterized protein n=1 Tax=Winogradskyella flava TaxID=1884876 RepID=A0A842IUN9_9FLAO|nr:hypothetical protein [Winogradskyella flava]MBC2846681.1 hypothetical protein [Winogradskyella flava]